MGGGGDGLHVLKTPENMVNKHSRVTEYRRSYSCKLEVSSITAYRKDERTAAQMG